MSSFQDVSFLNILKKLATNNVPYEFIKGAEITTLEKYQYIVDKEEADAILRNGVDLLDQGIEHMNFILDFEYIKYVVDTNAEKILRHMPL